MYSVNIRVRGGARAMRTEMHDEGDGLQNPHGAARMVMTIGPREGIKRDKDSKKWTHEANINEAASATPTPTPIEPPETHKNLLFRLNKNEHSCVCDKNTLQTEN